MTFEEFEKELLAKGIIKECKEHKEFNQGNPYINKYLFESQNDYCSCTKTIWYVWIVGGIEGGNYKGRAATEPVSADEEPNLELFDKIIKKYHPNVGHFIYLDFINKYVKYDEHKQYEYYGNYTEYKIKTLKLIDIYNLLVSQGELNGE